MFDPKRHIRMSEMYQKSRKTKWEDRNDEPPRKEQRSSTNQFLLFCDFILTYEKYKPYKDITGPASSRPFLLKEMNDSAYSPGSSDSRTSDSFSSESNSSFNNSESVSEDNKSSDTDTEDDSFNLITCYCMKPFANRPMIECSVCQTWLHMSCAIVRSNNIPEHFVCQLCQDAKSSRRRSARIKGSDRRFFHA